MIDRIERRPPRYRKSARGLVEARIKILRLHDKDRFIDFVGAPACSIVEPEFRVMLRLLGALVARQESSRGQRKNLEAAKTKFELRYGSILRRFYRVHRVQIKSRTFRIPFFNKHFFTDKQAGLFGDFARLVCRYEKHFKPNVLLYETRGGRKRDANRRKLNKKILVYREHAKRRVAVLWREFLKLRKKYTLRAQALAAARPIANQRNGKFNDREWLIIEAQMPGLPRAAHARLANLLAEDYSKQIDAYRSKHQLRSGLS